MLKRLSPQPEAQPIWQAKEATAQPEAQATEQVLEPKPQRLFSRTIEAMEGRVTSYRQAREQEKTRKREEPSRRTKQKTEEQVERDTFAVTREKAKPEEELPIENSRQFYGYEPQGREEPQPTVTRTGRQIMGKATNFFSGMTGFLFVLNAAVFGYYIYPQSLFIVNYIYSTGIVRFLSSYNTGYYFSFLNLILALLSFVGGILMFTRQEKGHMFSAVVGAMVILAATYEYMQSSLIYLLAVSAIAFVGIGTLTYARMSAASRVEEREELAPEEIDWPRIKTF